MRDKKRILFTFLMILLASYSDFYTGAHDGDLWRVPLINPYELVNIADVRLSDNGNSEWSLNLHYSKLDGISSSLNVSMVNVDKRVIYGYGSKYPSSFFIINVDSKEEKLFKQRPEWENALRQLDLAPDSVHDVWLSFTKFKVDGYLQWRPK